jgi:hypothetical protein
VVKMAAVAVHLQSPRAASRATTEPTAPEFHSSRCRWSEFWGLPSVCRSRRNSHRQNRVNDRHHPIVGVQQSARA